MKTHGLTDRQWDIACRRGRGEEVKDIAADLGLAHRTVYEHLNRIAFVWQLDPTKDIAVQIALRLLAERPAAWVVMPQPCDIRPDNAKTA